MNIDKISFLFPQSEEFLKLVRSLRDEERELVKEITEFYHSDDSETEFKFSISDGALLVRTFFADKYSFVFPYEITDGCDVCAAVDKIVRYAVLEETESVFVNVPAESVPVFFTLGFRHISADADSDDGTYRVVLNNELSLFDGDFDTSFDGVDLSCVKDADASDYARLWRDDKNNEYWGYDFREDYAEASDNFFVELAERECALSSAISLAVRCNGIFVGEAVLSCFDCKGGADVSIRILPEHQKRGYAKKALRALLELASSMGLVKLYARVYKKNLASIRLFSKAAAESCEDGDTVVFSYSL